MSKYDLIGDIHGCADELVQLLEKLGYVKDSDGVYRYHNSDSARKVIFVGDLVDRGPKIRETLEIVKKMVDNGTALCIQGNHEYNAIQFWELCDWPDKGYKRPHNHKNLIQHLATIRAFQNREDEWFSYLDWFKSLPYYLDLPELRVVHATWDDQLPNILREDVIANQFDWKAILEKCLKGEEAVLPSGSFKDKDGNVRTKARSKWWIDTTKPGLTFLDYLEDYAISIPGLDKIGLMGLGNKKGYSPTAKPVFFGHYWLRGEPKLQADNVCCLDYSVAKGGNLVAYRFDGEQKLDKTKFVVV